MNMWGIFSIIAEPRKCLAENWEELTNRRFTIGVVGTLKTGKSSVINALLGETVLPTDIPPCTAVPVRVTYSEEPRVELRMYDGSVQEIGIEKLPNYVTKLTEASKNCASGIDEAVVYYPCRFCQNGVDIVDTPGLDCDSHTDPLCKRIIHKLKLDAVIMVLQHDHPFSISEAEFMRDNLMSNNLSRIIFLVNKMDKLRRPEDKHRIVDEIKKKIQAVVLEKMADLYGEDSKQYRDAKMKQGNIRVFPFSALNALEGKQAGDEAIIGLSGMKPFEDVLSEIYFKEH